MFCHVLPQPMTELPFGLTILTLGVIVAVTRHIIMRRRSSSLAPSHQSIGRTTTRTFQSQTCKAAVSDAVTGSKEITYTSFEGNTWSFAFPRTGIGKAICQEMTPREVSDIFFVSYFPTQWDTRTLLL